MPGPQFDELKLQVSLVDNATTQLKSIKSALDELGTGSQANNMERLKRHTSEIDEALRKMIDTLSKGPKGFLDLGRGVAVAGISLGTFALAAEKMGTSLNSMTKSLQELGHVARATNVDPAVIKAVEQAYIRSGQSAEKARNDIAGAADAIVDLQRRMSHIRSEMLKGYENQPLVQAQIKEALASVDRAPDFLSKLNAMKKGADDLFESISKISTPEQARDIRNKYLKELNTTGLLHLKGPIESLSEAQSKSLRHKVEEAEKFQTITQDIAIQWRGIVTSMQTNLMNSGLIKALQWLDNLLIRWRSWLNAPPKTPEQKAQDAASKRPPSAPVTRPKGYRPYNPRSPTRLFGSDMDVGGDSGTEYRNPGIPAIGDLLGAPINNQIRAQTDLGFGTGWRGLPKSGNVTRASDADQQRGLELMQNQNEGQKSLKDEIHRLNALLSGEEKPAGQKFGMLAMPGGGRAGIGGGIGGGGGGYDGGGGDGTRYPSVPAAARPVGPTNAPPGHPFPLIGPGGAPMPPWGTTTAGFGGGAGGGAAGGVPGLAGGPSGRALTPEERRAGGTGGAPGATATYGASTAKQAVAQEVANEMRRQGFSENAIAGMLANIKEESSFDPTLRHADQPRYGGEAHYAHGLFQEGGAEWNTWAADMRARGLDPMQAWKDPKEAAAFVARRLKGELGDQQYAQLYRDLQNAKSPQEAARLFASRYLKPAAPYLRSRIAGFERNPPPGVEAYTGKATSAVPPTPSTATTATPGQGGGVGAINLTGSGKRGPQKLEDIVELAARQTGVSVDVTSGIEGGHKRHALSQTDIGAYDLKLKDPATGKYLDANNPQDREKMATFIENAAAAGSTGIGHGPGYMGSSGIHVGGGGRGFPDIAWGAKGRSANAPQWVIDAYNRGKARRMSDEQRQAELTKLREAAKTQVASTSATAPTTKTPAASATTPPTDPSKSLYDKLREQEEEHKRTRVTRFDLKEARDRLDKLLAPKKVNGTGDIKVSVKPERTRTGRSGVLKKIPLHRFHQGEKADSGPSQPHAATGESHDPNLDS